jgi:glutamate-ammonia-ligase adenylyltransferase
MSKGTGGTQHAVLEPMKGAHAIVDPEVRADYSRFVQRVRRRYAAELPLLPPGVPAFDDILSLVGRLQAGGPGPARTLPSALRVARNLVVERLAVLDVEQGAPLSVVTGTMTALAEATLELALAHAESEADALHGAPIDSQQHRVQLWIVGMGKLGGRELNVSSDIDLIYVYEEGGQTTGPRPVSFHEYFEFVVKRLYALIGESTDDGFVFRMDLALRPNGASGPPAVSLAMLEEYLQVQGREWERFAWLKSRVVAPRLAVASGLPVALRSLVVPFVYRRYLDYGIFEGLRQLHRKIREEATRRAAGRPARANDVKLSRGGIREIEFIVQLLLVVRGGQFPEIRTRSTLRGLERLVGLGLMRADTGEKLAAGYDFLRRVEHRVQYLDDQQTHLLPTQDDDLTWVAQSLHLPVEPSPGCAMLDRLCEVRELVAAEFDALLRDGQGAGLQGNTGTCRGCAPSPLSIDSEALLDRLPQELAARLRPWSQHPRILALRDESRLRLGRLMQRTAQAIQEEACSSVAAGRFIDWIEPLLRRESYLALLVERPEVHRRLLRLLGIARWPMQYLMRHPGVIDELADEGLLLERFDRKTFCAELDIRVAAWRRAGEDDEEKLLDALRRAHHAEVFRTLVRDVEGRLTVEQVADDLSALADAVLDVALRWCWSRLKQRHREVSSLAVIAYGKLGGRELGYGSDLDVVFVHDDGGSVPLDESALRDGGPSLSREQAQTQELYGAFVRKLIMWLTVRTSAGELFDIDTALRPNGNSGLLVTSIESFEHYQIGRGSNTAWTWEHQALTRARFAAGSPSVAARFEATRRAVLTAPRDHDALRREVGSMRERVRAARPVPEGRFDVKHSPGGMMDVEFAVQYLVLAHGATHAPLLDNAGNIALLLRAEWECLLPPDVGCKAADAYRDLSRAQHRARLDERPTQFDPAELAGPRDAVLALWQAVFG